MTGEDGAQVAVITGGARGIGAAIAERLATDGTTVVVWDVDATETENRVDHLERSGHSAGAEVVDVSDPASVAAATENTIDRYGRIDVLINNAGVAGTSAPLWEQEVSDWERVIDIDLTGVFLCCRAIVPAMREREWGRIVNIASIAGKEGNPNAAPYSAAKAGVIGLTKSLAKELAEDGDDVLVNCITPAVIETEILDQVSQEHLRYMLEKIPLGRPGTPEEVAEMVAWLASERCSFSTGAVFDISGGRATY